jgi:hypothetical protein
MSKLIAKLILSLIRLILRDKTNLVLENFAMCHQLEVIVVKKPKVKKPYCIFWARLI